MPFGLFSSSSKQKSSKPSAPRPTRARSNSLVGSGPVPLFSSGRRSRSHSRQAEVVPAAPAQQGYFPPPAASAQFDAHQRAHEGSHRHPDVVMDACDIPAPKIHEPLDLRLYDAIVPRDLALHTFQAQCFGCLRCKTVWQYGMKMECQCSEGGRDPREPEYGIIGQGQRGTTGDVFRFTIPLIINEDKRKWLMKERRPSKYREQITARDSTLAILDGHIPPTPGSHRDRSWSLGYAGEHHSDPSSSSHSGKGTRVQSWVAQNGQQPPASMPPPAPVPRSRHRDQKETKEQRERRLTPIPTMAGLSDDRHRRIAANPPPVPQMHDPRVQPKYGDLPPVPPHVDPYQRATDPRLDASRGTKASKKPEYAPSAQDFNPRGHGTNTHGVSPTGMLIPSKSQPITTGPVSSQSHVRGHSSQAQSSSTSRPPSAALMANVPPQAPARGYTKERRHEEGTAPPIPHPYHDAGHSQDRSGARDTVKAQAPAQALPLYSSNNHSHGSYAKAQAPAPPPLSARSYSYGSSDPRAPDPRSAPKTSVPAPPPMDARSYSHSSSNPRAGRTQAPLLTSARSYSQGPTDARVPLPAHAPLRSCMKGGRFDAPASGSDDERGRRPTREPVYRGAYPPPAPGAATQSTRKHSRR
ncbi:hypothetical protein PUNSTDRAFT_117047 [Punctularia strigosozonata HHB-11173 SS5]|uniref:uncharacterized protein n=1 Tax=Punctularia strigosozonata (strain HHB-11173) TaxID=741275 RepID=UPI0004417B69|nr:uncharacterized protein PUNSTDRAFT_117047 [Punctularia strigosozonata HHB-11173 SS5]EIN13119.1 hypothetical protein PUNSTDRAFT_117047 [Punctularia strigosozonata HHB-11173 SS5]